MELKTKIVARYHELVQDRIDAFRDMIAALTEDASNDAKGSAGDKHETALSMMHIEQEKLTHKLREFLDQKTVLDKIDANAAVSGVISLGSVVIANGMHLFVSAALPKITIDGITVIALSPQSPLGKELVGQTKGHRFSVGSTSYLVENVF